MYHLELIISLTIIEICLIVASLYYLRYVILIGKKLLTIEVIVTKILNLFNKIEKLEDTVSRQENNILSIIFHLNEIDMYIKIMLDKLEQQKESSVKKEN